MRKFSIIERFHLTVEKKNSRSKRRLMAAVVGVTEGIIEEVTRAPDSPQ